MMTFSEFIVFLILSVALLVIVGINDEKIRNWEDRQIERIKAIIVDKTSEKN